MGIAQIIDGVWPLSYLLHTSFCIASIHYYYLHIVNMADFSGVISNKTLSILVDYFRRNLKQKKSDVKNVKMFHGSFDVYANFVVCP